MTIPHLEFDVLIGRQKPESIINKNAKCPFCDRSQLTDIIDQEGSLLLIKNKYPVLKNTLQTVLIETEECHSELSCYEPEHLHRVFAFGFRHWLSMEASGKYKSVIFFKNHGPLSGGTIRHPHMQIVGLEDVDYHEVLNPSTFEGITLSEKDGVILNLSTKPRIGFSEFNIIATDATKTDIIADYVQTVVCYIMHDFPGRCANSYNLFFYHYENQYIAKVMPRFATSPLFIGFGLPQVSNRLHAVAEHFCTQYAHRLP